MHVSDTDSVGSDSSQSTSDDSLHFMGDCDSKLEQARINLASLALICKRFQLSGCVGAVAANAVIKDLNSSNLLINYDDSLTIDRSKLRRERVIIAKKRERMTTCNFLASIAYLWVAEKI